MSNSQITCWCHGVIRSQVKTEGYYIDATMGNGNDTLFLCRLAGEKGKVTAFDIQEEAVRKTRRLLKEHKMEHRAELVLAGHEYMDRYAGGRAADVICFNFGYLPGGNHEIATRPDTSIEAIEKGLGILKPGGMMSLCIYSGKDTGFEEKQSILAYLGGLPSGVFTVIANEYYNRINNPPMPVFIFKEE